MLLLAHILSVAINVFLLGNDKRESVIDVSAAGE
jgi:hypothetical protein